VVQYKIALCFNEHVIREDDSGAANMKKQPCGLGRAIPFLSAGAKLLSISMFVAGLLAQQLALAQGTTTYLSNLGQASAGSLAVGSDSWLAAPFGTGFNAGGYVLDSAQLSLTDASGNRYTVLWTR
jgi:hypothetical protein